MTGKAHKLADQGRFSEALHTLGTRGCRSSSSLNLLRAELFERTGELCQADSSLASVENGDSLPPQLIARCYLLRALVESHRGHLSAAISYLSHAWECASDAGDVALQCWTRLRAMSLTGSDSVCWKGHSQPPNDLLEQITSTGQPTLNTAFHVFSAEQAAKRGDTDNARQHALAARLMLSEAPNPWLEGLVALHESCVAFLDADFSTAHRSACAALTSARLSGHRRTRALAIGNLAAVYLAMGHLARADVCIEQAILSVTPEEQLHGLFLESQAEIRLANGQTQACRCLLDAADAEAREFNQQRSDWYSHWTTATRLRLLQHEGKTSDALDLSNRTASALGGDAAPATQRARLAIVLSMLDGGNLEDAERELARLMAAAPLASPRAVSQTEFLRAYLENLARPGSVPKDRFEGALRLQVGSGDGADLLLTCMRYLQTTALTIGRASSIQQPGSGTRLVRPPRPNRTYSRLDGLVSSTEPVRPNLERLTGLLWNAAHGHRVVDILLEELVRILAARGTVDGARLVVRDPHGSTYDAVKFGRALDPADQRSSAHLHLPIVCRGGQACDLTLWVQNSLTARTDALSLAGLVQRFLSSGRLAELLPVLPPLEGGSVQVEGCVFASKPMRELLANARLAAKSRATVLLTGETGTGKEVLARVIHALAEPKRDRFLAFNCAAVPRDLAESQLFGHRRGSYTGAVDSSPGILRSASGGTLFLDEIADLPLEIQPKLLRFLDRGEVLPLGEFTPHQVSLQVIAAANANLDEMLQTGRLRPDLYYRLAIVHFHIPPLRERRDDVLPLARHFLESMCQRQGKELISLSADAQGALMEYGWPGNVRELANVINRLIVFTGSGGTITAGMLPEQIRKISRKPVVPEQRPGQMTIDLDSPLQETLARVEQALIERAFLRSRGHPTETAKRLGVSRKGLYLKRQRLGWTRKAR